MSLTFYTVSFLDGETKLTFHQSTTAIIILFNHNRTYLPSYLILLWWSSFD